MGTGRSGGRSRAAEHRWRKGAAGIWRYAPAPDNAAYTLIPRGASGRNRWRPSDPLGGRSDAKRACRDLQACDPSSVDASMPNHRYTRKHRQRESRAEVSRRRRERELKRKGKGDEPDGQTRETLRAVVSGKRKKPGVVEDGRDWPLGPTTGELGRFAPHAGGSSQGTCRHARTSTRPSSMEKA